MKHRRKLKLHGRFCKKPLEFRRRAANGVAKEKLGRCIEEANRCEWQLNTGNVQTYGHS